MSTEKISSNVLFPATNTVLGLKTPKTYTTEQFSEFCRTVETYEYKAAEMKVEEGEQRKAEFEEKLEKINEAVNELTSSS